MSKDQEAIDQSIMLKAMQQQFVHMNLMFGEICDKLERQDAAIANLQRGQQPIAPNVRGNRGLAVMGEEDGNDIDDFDDQATVDMRGRDNRRTSLVITHGNNFIVNLNSFIVLLSYFSFFHSLTPKIMSKTHSLKDRKSC